MVGSADVDFKIQLEALALKHATYCSYEPELFPGLIYRIIQPKIVLLIFNSGKVVLTGRKSLETIVFDDFLFRSQRTSRNSRSI